MGTVPKISPRRCTVWWDDSHYTEGALSEERIEEIHTPARLGTTG